MFEGLIAGLLLDLDNETATGLESFDNISVFEATQREGEVRGVNRNTTWRFSSSANEVTTSQGNTIRYFTSIVGGSRNDRFEIETFASLPQFIQGGGGDDTLATVQRIGGIFADWSLTGAGAGIFSQQGQNLAFSSIENLAPNSGNDFISFPRTPTRDWFTSLNGGGSFVDVIYGDANPAVSLEVNLQDRTANGLRSWNGVTGFSTTLQNSQIVGRNVETHWQLDLTGGISDGLMGAYGFTTLIAGSADDYFHLFITGSEPGTEYPINLQASAGSNWLDYSRLVALPGNVNLQTGVADYLATIAGFSECHNFAAGRHTGWQQPR